MKVNESIFSSFNSETHWYALKTKYQHEKRVNQQLFEKGITTYLPLEISYRKWSDRTKKSLTALFPCYLFVHIKLKNRIPVLETNGSIQLVSFNHIPAPIPEPQINSIRKLLENKAPFEKTDFIHRGQKVEVVNGQLKGLTGSICQIKGKNRLLIAIDVLQKSIAVDIELNQIRPIPPVGDHPTHHRRAV